MVAGAQVPVIQIEKVPRMAADGAAHLESRALPSGAAAAQVGENCPQEDGGQQPDGQGLSVVYRVDDVVGALALRLCQLVEGHDHQSRRRQTPQQPGMLLPQLCGPLHTDVEQGAHHAAADAGDQRHRQPLGHGLDVKAHVGVAMLLFQSVHFPSPPPKGGPCLQWKYYTAGGRSLQQAWCAARKGQGPKTAGPYCQADSITLQQPFSCPTSCCRPCPIYQSRRRHRGWRRWVQ